MPVALTPKAFKALSLLASQAGRLVAKETFLTTLWPDTFVEEGNLTSTIWMVRKALAGYEHWIETVPKRGYLFTAPVTDLAAEAPSPGPRDVQRQVESATTTSLVFRPIVWFAAAALLIALVPWYWRSTTPSVEPVASPQPARLQLVPVTTFPGAELEPALSPDGTRVAFSWSGDHVGRAIYVMTLGADTPTRLTLGTGRDGEPSWSPDGAQVAFLRRLDVDRMALALVPGIGGPERVVTTYRFPQTLAQYSPPAWAPDAKSLLVSVFTGRRYTVHEVSLDSGVMRPLALGDGGIGDFGPVLNADATRLAFTRYIAGPRNGTLMLQTLAAGLSAAGSAVPVDGAGTQPKASAWSPDGRVLSYSDGTRIMEWEDGRGVRQVYVSTSELGGASTRWHNREGRDTRQTIVAEQSRDLDVWSLPLDQGMSPSASDPVLVVRSTESDEHPRFSPDATQLAFISARSGTSEVWLSDADGSNQRQLTHLGAFISGFARWSPDGAMLAFHARVPEQADLYVFDLATGAQRKLAAGCCPSWSSDGRYLFATSVLGPPVIRRVQVSDGRVDEWFPGDLPVEVPGRRQLLYAKSLAPGLYWRSLEGDPARNLEHRLVDDYVPPSGGFVALEDGIVYSGFSKAGQSRAFRFFDFTSRMAKDIAPAPAFLGLGLSLSPDRRRLLYATLGQNAGADLFLLELDARTP